jgi:hypothetical protein
VPVTNIDPNVAPAPRTMTLHGLRFLQALAGKATSGCFLEIGPLFGSSTQAIAASRRLDAPLHTIDTFEPADWIVRRMGFNLSRAAFDKHTSHIPDLVVHEGFAPDVVRDTWSEPIGFYFDDATHGDPGWSNNFDFFSQHFTEDAIICGDDFAGGWPDIVRNVSEIAKSWDVGLYVMGRVWAMTRVEEERIVSAAEIANPGLAGAVLEATHGANTDSKPATCWSNGLHRRTPLASFRVAGDPVAQIRFITMSAYGAEPVEYAAGDWIQLSGVSAIVVSGAPDIGLQLCLSRPRKTENTKVIKVGESFRIPDDATVVAVRLDTV